MLRPPIEIAISSGSSYLHWQNSRRPDAAKSTFMSICGEPMEIAKYQRMKTR
jgi:hypothetical protein